MEKKYRPLALLPTDEELEELTEDFGGGAVMCFLAVMACNLTRKSELVNDAMLPQWAAAVGWCWGKYLELEERGCADDLRGGTEAGGGAAANLPDAPEVSGA